jgi:RimJ/RimL family protein N-acetyltransferase
MSPAGFVLSPEHVIHLRTERLVMRRFTQDDVELIVELDSDPEVTRWVGEPEPTTRTLVETLILPKLLGWHAAHANHGFWATHEVTTREFIGWFHYRPAKVAPHEPELGYRLRRAAWGKGYATEGSRALLAHAFEVLGDARVVAEAFRANRASTRVMEKLGMVHEREELEYGQPVDWYAVDAERFGAAARLLRGA